MLKFIPKSINLAYFRNWSFLYKLFFGLFIIALILGSYIENMIDLAHLNHDVELWIKSLEAQDLTLDSFLQEYQQTFGQRSNHSWISIYPDYVLQNQTNDGPIKIATLISNAKYGSYTIAFFSYFTTISNFSIGLWFLYAAIRPQNEGKKGYLGYSSTLILTTYITITMLIWLGLLLPTNLSSGTVMSAKDWFTGLMQHLILPLAFIGYVCFTFKSEKLLTTHQYMKKEWWKVFFLLLGYGLYCLIRGEIRYRTNQPSDTLYPYFFFRIHEAKVMGLPGFAWFMIAILLIAAIAFGFSISYNFIQTKRFPQYLVLEENKNEIKNKV
ncbi:hypothetical protein JN01_0503 [Entomoplasma freundtii]|uniref:Uncharacterized protein n=1 Tax=Entomoplasma freundtii TaxID=74700 RepID=A0A2K8NQN4_9MOLU|nr:Pr6Pr family membrane protein [Entomoplasma freundtii]ATZ16097.1 hypothetical protein EFREU_v1c00700 [Entomoplasma freundtii]TDY57002.1 hypothetical protein JN01_0503 [Entomoplasma freundtii]